MLFGLDENGHIKPGSSRIPGTEVIKDADMPFSSSAFLFGDKTMQPIIDYLDKGGPVAGLRTTTHGFNGLKGKNSKYNYNSRNPE